jgi:sugar phosphate isomerase/epimerase
MYIRHGWIWVLAAILGVGSLQACPARAQSAPNAEVSKIVVGAHPWVYAAKLPGYDITPVLPQIFADLEYAGFDAIELIHSALRPDDAVERISALSRQHKVAVLGASFGGDMWNREQHAAILADAELIIPRLAQLGGRTLGISVGAVQWGAQIRKTPEQLDAQAELLEKLFALCARHNVVPNLHNHTYEVENGLHDLKGTLARLPDAKLGPDLNWLVRGGVDPAQFLRDFGPHIVFLHVRDQARDGRWSEAVGEGDMDWDAIAAALHEIRFRGDVVVELAHEADFQLTRPLRESLKISRQFIRKKLGY